MKIINLHAPVHIYMLPYTNFAEGALLLMVYSFRKKGLVLFNERLAEYLGCSERYVREMLKDLRRKDYVRIEKPRSRYRRIFPTEKMFSLLDTIENEGTILSSGKGKRGNYGAKKRNHSVVSYLKGKNSKTFTEEKPLCVDKTSQPHTGKNLPQAKPDYSAALAQHTRDISEEEADELMRGIYEG